MTGYGSPARGSQPSQLLTVFLAVILATTVYLTLVAVIYFSPQASLSTFDQKLAIAFVASVAVFSSHNLLNSIQDLHFSSMLPKLTVRWMIVFMIVLLSAYLDKTAEELSRLVMVIWLFVTPFTLFGASLGLRLVAILFYSNPDRRRKAVLIWSNSACADLVASLRTSPLAAIDMVGFFDNRNESRPPSNLARLGELSEAADWIRDPDTGEMKVDVVFIGLNTREPAELAEIIAILQDSTVSTYFVPESLIFGMPGIQIRELAGKPVLASTETPFIGVAAFPKRLLDIFGSLCGLLLLSPLMIATALAVKFSSPGPVLFKQKRYGVAGKPIQVYKFRSMKTSAPNAPVIQATQGDSRVTAVGRFIRKTSIDELPQLLNVLKGEMSLVGPRPHAVEHNELYRKLVSGYMLRHKIKPGITGWAQVNGFRGETNTLEKMEKRIEYDLYYIQNWSVWMDITIIWRTVAVLFGDKNAY